MNKITRVFILVFLILIGAVLPVCGQSNGYVLQNYVSNVRSYKADSEVQAASDLAVYAGYNISPENILSTLLLSDDPNTGFVGYYDEEPQVPPNTYGVYQGPLAAALQSLGVPAHGSDTLSTDDIKAYISAGMPVMCWVIGQTTNGSAFFYTPANGNMTSVAYGMNAVVVIGFDQYNFTIADNGTTYTRSFSAFELSWLVLGRRALVIGDTLIRGNNSVDQVNNIQYTASDGWFEGWPDWDQGFLSDNSSQGGIPEVTPQFDWYFEDYQDDEWNWNYQEDAQAAQEWSQDWNDESITVVTPDPVNSGTSNQWLPVAASIPTFHGQAQSYTLDCETRSAIDLASYYGYNIGHAEFLNSLPKSDDPNLGFVGNYTDPRGHIPPASYGVYQEPVASLLRSYGVPASGYMYYSWESIKAEVATGNPVMVWVVGNTETGQSVPYTTSSGNTTNVVPYQHTVVVIGYDSQNVTLQDGAKQYTRSIDTFLNSWAALDNRAIVIG